MTDKKAYIITGASSGIGEACARLLATPETTLILVARSVEKLDVLKRELPGNIVSMPYDLHDLEHIGDVFRYCKENEIKLDGMIYCAGINAECPIKVNQISLMREAMEINCFAFLEMGKHFFKKKNSLDHASIVVISSVASLLCEKGMTPYSMSKAALNAVVKTMAKEFISRKIRVNAILPGGVETPMTRKKSETYEGFDQEDSQPLGLISPEEVAGQVEFLLSDKAKHITGECMVVSGGCL